MPIERFVEGDELQRSIVSQPEAAAQLRKLGNQLCADLKFGASNNHEKKPISQDLVDMFTGLTDIKAMKPDFFDKRCKDIFASMNAYKSWELVERYSPIDLVDVHGLINNFLRNSQLILGAHSKVYMDDERATQETFLKNLYKKNLTFSLHFMSPNSATGDNERNLKYVRQKFDEIFNHNNLDAKMPALDFQKQCREVSKVICDKSTQETFMDYKPNNNDTETITDANKRLQLFKQYREDIKKFLKTDEKVQEMHFFGKTSSEHQNYLANITDAIMQKISRTYA